MKGEAKMQLSVALKPDSQWEDDLRQLGGNLFHTPQWAASRISGSHRPHYMRMVDDAGRCYGLALGMENRSALPLIGGLSKQLELETYPVVLDDQVDLLRAMVDRIIEYAASKGFRKAVFNSYMGRVLLEDPIRMGVQTQKRIEFVIDLSRTDSELFSGFKTHHKRKIKKARKHGMEFAFSQDLESMQKFRTLQVRSRDRRLDRGEQMAVLEDTYYEELGKRYFKEDIGTVFMMLHEGSPVSAAFVAHYGDHALYMYGGSSDVGFRMDAPVLLFTHIFAHYREKGFRRFNLGGVPAEAMEPDTPSHGLYRFKAGFGGEQVLCSTVTADHLNPGRDKLLNLAKRMLPVRG